MDLTSLWVLLKNHYRLLSNISVALLIFIAGWHLGRAMSPYYAAHPIIFEERECDTCNSAGGTAEELVSLQQPSASPTPAAVAGATTNEQTTKIFVASVNSTLYHHADCPSAKRIKQENQIWFSSPGEAEAAGYSPSKCTIQKLE